MNNDPINFILDRSLSHHLIWNSRELGLVKEYTSTGQGAGGKYTKLLTRFRLHVLIVVALRCKASLLLHCSNACFAVRYLSHTTTGTSGRTVRALEMETLNVFTPELASLDAEFSPPFSMF